MLEVAGGGAVVVGGVEVVDAAREEGREGEGKEVLGGVGFGGLVDGGGGFETRLGWFHWMF